MKKVASKNRGGQPVLPEDYRVRSYRKLSGHKGFHRFQVVCQETDLLIQADHKLDRLSHELVVEARAYIEGFIHRYPEFETTLTPWPEGEIAPAIVRSMIQAGRLAGVGPMAAVAGAVAESVGKGLLKHCHQVIVENGGDIFLRTENPVVVGLFAGPSPLSLNVGIRVNGSQKGLGICTSSATVGHSLSTGGADAVCVLSSSCSTADAVATTLGNRIKTPNDVQPTIDFGTRIEGVKGIVIVAGKKLGAWGEVELVPFKGKKG